MKTIIIIIILLLVIYILCINKSNKTDKTQTIINYPTDYEDFDLDKILKDKSKDKNMYDDLEKMIELELSKKYDEQINITVPKPSADFTNINSNTMISSKINSNVGNKTLWDTFDKLVDDNSAKIKHFDKLESNYSMTNAPVLEYGGEKGSLYFDTY